MNNIFYGRASALLFCASASWQKGKLMTTAELIKIAKVIYAEGGIFSGKIWRPAWHLPLRFHQISTIHSVYRQHKQYSSRESDVFQMHIFYSFEVLRSIQTGMGNQTKKSLQTCTKPMTIWVVIPYQISGDIFILE